MREQQVSVKTREPEARKTWAVNSLWCLISQAASGKPLTRVGLSSHTSVFNSLRILLHLCLESQPLPGCPEVKQPAPIHLPGTMESTTQEEIETGLD